MKKTDGFTLIELVIGIVATALVSGAIMTFLLMGMKTNRSVINANEDQRNARIIITMMEKLASEGSIATVESVGNSNTNPDWVVLAPPVDEDDPDTAPVILSYTAASNSLRGRDGVILMEGVLASTIEIEDDTLPGTGCLLKFGLTTAAGEYETSIFCRSEVITASNTSLSAGIDGDEVKVNSTLINPASQTEARLEFLRVLINQQGSDGRIIENGEPTIPYSLWYCGGAYWPNWNANTPWCACFASWAIDQVSDRLTTVPCEANVDNLYSRFDSNKILDPETSTGNVLPGDLIFFNWDSDSELEHVGVVLLIQGDYVYTIEGNSGNHVALRRYETTSRYIHGYGVLNWK